MNYDPRKHQRKSIRLKGYDYAKNGLYFITLNVQDRKCIFGTIKNGIMHLNEGGQVAQECWLAIPDHYPHVKLHAFIIMPNHVHGILEIATKKDNSGDEKKKSSIEDDTRANKDAVRANKDGVRANNYSPRPFRSPSRTIGSIIRGYKIGVTKWHRQNTDQYKVWQRDYYDIIIRDERSYQNISRYILNNPQKWAEDSFYMRK